MIFNFRDFTAYLSKDVTDDVTELESGALVPMKCKEPTKVLNGTFRNFSLECLHGSFQTPSEVPEAEDCITGKIYYPITIFYPYKVWQMLSILAK